MPASTCKRRIVAAVVVGITVALAVLAHHEGTEDYNLRPAASSTQDRLLAPVFLVDVAGPIGDVRSGRSAWAGP